MNSCIPELPKLSAEFGKTEFFIMNRFPDADQRADTVDGNAALTEVFAEMTQERGIG